MQTTAKTDVEFNEKQIVQEKEYKWPSHWLLVKAFKERYESVSALIAREISKEITSGAILEIGCGDGKGLNDIYQTLGTSFQYTGTDFSLRALKFAEAFNLNTGIEFIHGTAGTCRTMFGDRRFDVIIYRDVIEHLNEEELFIALNDSAERLTKNGIIIITVPSVNDPLHPKHYRHYDKMLLTNHLTNAGLSIQKILGYVHQPRWLYPMLKKIAGLPVFWKLYRIFMKETHPNDAKILLAVAKKSK